MKIIHHRLKDGMADPIEVEFSDELLTEPEFHKDQIAMYLCDAMRYEYMGNSGTYISANQTGPLDNHPSKVFLLAHGNDASSSTGEVIVSNKPWELIRAYNRWSSSLKFEKYQKMDLSFIHLQEYESFEMAYSVALAMREGHPLCYNQ